MQQLNLITGKTKEDIAIDFIREHEPDEGYFLGFSGGKDSQVLYHLTKDAGVKFKAYYAATGIDPPELVRFIKNNYPEIEWVRPQTSFWARIKTNGYPTKLARWCCDYLKKDPTKHIKLNHRLMGLRAEESFARAKRGQISKLKKQIMYKPIFFWKEWEVWDYIEKKHLSYCSLYDEGFGRIGCVCCPFLCSENQSRINKAKERWPKFFKTFEHAMTELYDSRDWYRMKAQGRAMTSSEYINNWYHGRSGVKNWAETKNKTKKYEGKNG